MEIKNLKIFDFSDDAKKLFETKIKDTNLFCGDNLRTKKQLEKYLRSGVLANSWKKS